MLTNTEKKTAFNSQIKIIKIDLILMIKRKVYSRKLIIKYIKQ